MDNAKFVSAGIIIITGIVVFVTGMFTADSWNPTTAVQALAVAANPTPIPSTAANSPWLKGTTDEKFAQIEKHLRGLDMSMAEIGYRYGELYFAARERNWDYARYQMEKIDLSMRLALERRPKRASSSQAFLNDDIPAVVRAIESKNVSQMNRSLDQLHNSCVACHRSENVLHFRSTVERIRNNARR